jgi:CheY-like chemotaxis protein
MPLFVVTMVDNRHKAKALGADDFAEKPVDRAWLIDRLTSAIEGMPRERVLVVDDDAASRYLLGGYLSETRYEVVEASDGARALELVREASPVAVFLDLQMPGMSGEQVLERLRAEARTEELPVVVYTSRVLDPPARARLAGATAFVSKEASREAALRTIRDAMAGVEARAAARRGAR